jgi:hypothetical protein
VAKITFRKIKAAFLPISEWSGVTRIKLTTRSLYGNPRRLQSS